MKNILVLIFFGLLFLVLSVSGINIRPCKAEPVTIIVPDDFLRLQEAIENANSEDTIFVRKGIYNETVVIDKTLLLFGEDCETTIIDGNKTGHVIHVTADNVTIFGFTVKGSNPSREQDVYAGINLYNVSHCNVSGNILTNNSVGVMLAYSESCMLKKNSIKNNWSGVALAWMCDSNIICENNVSGSEEWASIYIDMSDNNTISGNCITNNDARGIFLRRSEHNTISENDVTNNTGGINPSAISIEEQSRYNTIQKNQVTFNEFGVKLNQSDDNFLFENYFVNNYCGILVYSSENNTIHKNYLARNYGAIEITHASSFNIVSQNNVVGNSYGIGFWYSNNNTIRVNTVRDNELCGLLVSYSRNNKIYHNNLINNTEQISTSYGYFTLLDDNYPSGGNYWDNYTGIDTNHDGIGDTPYVINTVNMDRYPLMGIFHNYNTSIGKRVNIITNSTIDSFELCQPCGYIRILVSNMTTDQEYGFCRVSIPHGLIPTPYRVVISSTSPVYWNYMLYDNGSHRWIYFEYEHSTREIFIVPEFSGVIVFPLILMATVLVTLLRKKKIDDKYL